MDMKVIIQSLYYISVQLDKSIDKLTALKLIFFADRYHARKYARFITDDTYYAMEYGPVASNVKNFLSFDFSSLAEQEYSERFIRQENGLSYIAQENISEESLDMLSETDKEALDFSINSFGHKDSFQLVEETHKYPEWKRFENTLSDTLKREKILITDFFEDSNIQDDPYDIIPQEKVLLSKDFYLQGM